MFDQVAMTRTRRAVFGIGAGVFGTTALAACGGSEAQSQPAQQPTAAVKATGKVVHAMPAGSPDELLPRQSQMEAFQKKFGPALTVELLTLDTYDQKVQVMLASDTPPDTFSSGAVNVATQATNGTAKDLTPFIKRDKVDLSDFYPALIKAWTWQGKHIAFNDTWDTTVMFYNRDLFNRAGLKVPDASFTYDQWVETARKMTNPNNANEERPTWGGAILTHTPVVFNLIWSWGGEVFSPDGKRCLLNTPEAAAAVQWLADIWNKHQVAPPPSYTSQPGQNWPQLMVAGRVGMGMDANGLSTARTLMQATDLNWSVVAIPKGPKGRQNWMFASTTVMAGQAKNPEGAWAWLRYFTSPEGYDVRGGTETARSTHSSRANSPRLATQPWLTERGVIQAWKDSEATLHGPPQVVNYQAMNAEFGKAWSQVWSGQKTAKQALEEVVPVVNNLLAKT
ncbi:MAG: sugar ABC transporter substrate-binding protein [Chloroflexi bacterium]|nr:sugar ABC transporter substrate-binding protein [Chloroflexota bacterium]